MSVSKTTAAPKTHRRISVTDIAARKADTTPVVCLTAYTALTAKLLEDNVDLLLVGDSLGMVIHGMETTVGVTVEMMIAHGAAVVRGSSKPCIVVDLPFGSYQESPGTAFRTAARVMAETGCNAVKLEGGREMAATVKFLVERGIPVMGHIGLTPQHIHRFGGFRAQARTEAEALALVADALAIAEAGAFSIVIEAVPESSARLVTEQVQVPVIGIGAGQAVDGQILVTEDIAGLFIDFKPRFVKRYGELGAGIAEAARQYAEEVRAGAFPGPEHTYAAKRE